MGSISTGILYEFWEVLAYWSWETSLILSALARQLFAHTRVVIVVPNVLHPCSNSSAQSTGGDLAGVQSFHLEESNADRRGLTINHGTLSAYARVYLGCAGFSTTTRVPYQPMVIINLQAVPIFPSWTNCLV